MSEMFTEFLDIPSIVHFAVLHLEFIVPEKRVCDILLPAMHLMCHTNIVRKKKKKKAFSYYAGVEQIWSVSIPPESEVLCADVGQK